MNQNNDKTAEKAPESVKVESVHNDLAVGRRGALPAGGFGFLVSPAFGARLTVV